MGGRTARPLAREKACYANMRVILGAVEMYNMDHSIMLDSITNHDTVKGGLLEKGKYLKRGMTPTTPSCYYSGYNLTGTGTIVCDSHGTVEGP